MYNILIFVEYKVFFPNLYTILYNSLPHNCPMCFILLNTDLSDVNLSLSNKVSNTDPRLSDARTPTAHTHDERYYTEQEVNNLLANVFQSKTIPDGYGIDSMASPQHNGVYWMADSKGYIFGYTYYYLLFFSAAPGSALEIAIPYGASGLKYRMRVNGSWTNVVSVT